MAALVIVIGSKELDIVLIVVEVGCNVVVAFGLIFRKGRISIFDLFAAEGTS